MQDSHIHIGSLYQLFLEETQPFRKVHRMIDLFESIIKSHSVVILSEYVNHNQLSEAAKGMLSVGLRTPSLGTWQLFARVLFEELKVQGYEWSFADFPDEFSALDKALNADKTNVIAFRNSYAHGATPTDVQCKADVFKFEPFLVKLLSSKWLLNTVTEVRDCKVWISSKSKALCAHPLLVHKSEDGAPIAFFNDLKNDKVGLLNYPLSKHYREKEFFKEFHEYLPLNEWKKTGNSDFLQRIEELTETFKGRLAERSQIHDFVLTKSKGYLSIQGNPGIGKSALIAQVFKEIKSSNEAKQIYCIEYFIRRGTQQADVDYLLNYLIKRTDEVFSQGREIRAEGKMTFDLQNQLFSKWRLWAEHSQGKKLLFLIDGLDEGVEKNVLTYMPRENFENILIIYGSRPGGHKSIDELWSTLPPEHHICLQLEGLSIADIRALIYDVANKYELERESVWVDAVQQRSQGNPLYLRLLCNAIENGSIALNDLNALPKEIDEYYKAILSRYAQDMIDGDALLAGLFTFAAAKDYLTMAHLGLINQLGDATIQRIGSTLKEVLYENPLTDGVLDYQLFHESFREYLVKEKAKQVNDAAERILDFCASWDTLEGTWEQRYALEHYASHLSESKKEVRAKELWGMLENSKYKETQKKVLMHYDASRDLARIGLLKASELKQFDLQLECALQLVDLKYEEANDAPQVVALVADGEIDLALKRIESFGGADKEGVKRRFILYMLCLIELTLLGSKNRPHRRVAIGILLKHLDEQLPVDHSILNWNDFFPSYLMFQMASIWADLGLEYLLVFKRTEDWKRDWFAEKNRFCSFRFEVLLESARVISENYDKSSALRAISTELFKEGYIEQSAAALQEAIVSVYEMDPGYMKSVELALNSNELVKHGNTEEAASAIQEALASALGIDENTSRSSALLVISREMARLGQIEEALDCARDTISDLDKVPAMSAISTEIAKQGHLAEAATVLQEALACAYVISDDYWKSSSLKYISAEMAEQGDVEKALACARGISDDYWKSSSLKYISAEMAKQGHLVDATTVLRESLATARNIETDRINWAWSLSGISIEMAKQGQIKEALDCAHELTHQGIIFEQTLSAISAEMAKQGQLERAISVLHESLICRSGMKTELEKNLILSGISTELAKQGQLELGLTCALRINEDSSKNTALLAISAEMAKQGQLEQGLTCALSIKENSSKNAALLAISAEMVKQGHFVEGTSVLQEALDCARLISGNYDKSSALSVISAEMAKQGNIEWAAAALQEALVCVYGIVEAPVTKINCLAAISTQMAKQGQLEAAASALQEAITCVCDISDGGDRTAAQMGISIEMAKQGLIKESINYASEINDKFTKNFIWGEISSSLVRHGRIEEALACARGIQPEYFKNWTLLDISGELVKNGYIIKAENVGLEISEISVRHDCWRNIANINLEKECWKVALSEVVAFKNDEVRQFYLRGWSEKVKLNESTAECIAEALPFIVNDSESIESLLQKYAIQETLLARSNSALLQRLNHTLNIKWAIDIAAQFPNEETNVRLSTNVEAWLHEIVDEDDRDQIELWAKQVAKGKITEEEFGERVSEI